MDELHQLLKEFVEIYGRQSMRQFIGFLRVRGLSMSQMGTLLILHRRGDCGVTDIAEYSGITPAAASQLLNKLVDENYIERQEDKTDRRVKKIALTAKGQEIVHQSYHARQHWFAPLIDSMTEEELEMTKQVLSMLIEKGAVLSEPEIVTM